MKTGEVLHVHYSSSRSDRLSLVYLHSLRTTRSVAHPKYLSRLVLLALGTETAVAVDAISMEYGVAMFKSCREGTW